MRGAWREIMVGVLILAAAGLLAYMSIRVGSLRTPGGRTYVAYFDDAVGLVENAPVTAAGIKVGAVDAMEFDRGPDGEGRAKITIRVQSDFDLYDDARATIRARSLLGEKYFALDPGASGTALKSGSEIPTTPSADIDRLLAAVATLAEAAEPEDVHGIVHGLNELLNATAADGKSLPDAVAEIADSVNQLTTKANRLADDGTRLSRKMGPAIDKMGPALDDIQTVTQQLNSTLVKLDPAVDELPESVAKLNRVLTRLETLLEENEDLTKDSIVEELRKIVTQEGVYVRLSPRKENKRDK